MSVIHRSSRRASPRTVITTVARGSRWELIRIRIRDRLLARWRDLTLDAQLANGLHVEDDRLRAVRASTLTTLATRHKLATGWENVLDRTGQPRQPIDSHAPVRPSCVLAAEDDIRHMIALLRASTPVSARGVAIANLLLTDGTGPLYNSASTSDPVATVRDGISYLDPMTDLPT
jgi:hypothetical protein